VIRIAADRIDWQDLQQTLDDLSIWERLERSGPEMEAVVEQVASLLSDISAIPRSSSGSEKTPA
jgi:hypothetical protein